MTDRSHKGRRPTVEPGWHRPDFKSDLLGKGSTHAGEQVWHVYADPSGYRIEWWNGSEHVETEGPLASPEAVVAHLLAGGWLDR